MKWFPNIWEFFDSSISSSKEIRLIELERNPDHDCAKHLEEFFDLKYRFIRTVFDNDYECTIKDEKFPGIPSDISKTEYIKAVRSYIEKYKKIL